MSVDREVQNGLLLVPLFLSVQVALIIAAIFTVDLPTPGSSCLHQHEDGTATVKGTTVACGVGTDDASQYYMYYAHLAFMMYFGFGYLMTYLKRYMVGAVAFTMLVTALCLQLTLVLQGPIIKAAEVDLPYEMGIADLAMGLFGAATCLISFGAVIGLLSPIQLVIMCICEIPIWLVNFWIGTVKLEPAVLDVGGSILVHMFGAYFGVAVSLALYKANDPKIDGHRLNGSVYNSEMFSFVGVVFLLVLWPSFNAAVASPALRYRVILNTVLSISGSTIASFAASFLIGGTRSFHVGGGDVQNGVLAGGVAAGAIADFEVASPGVFLGIGILGGFLCVFGYQKISGFLERTLNLHDTCGVHNLHGMPGILSAVASIIVAAALPGAENGNFHIVDGTARSQILSVIITLTIALGGGFMTGCLIDSIKQPWEAFFNDAQWWEVDDVYTAEMEEHYHQPNTEKPHQKADAFTTVGEPVGRSVQAAHSQIMDYSTSGRGMQFSNS